MAVFYAFLSVFAYQAVGLISPQLTSNKLDVYQDNLSFYEYCSYYEGAHRTVYETPECEVFLTENVTQMRVLEARQVFEEQALTRLRRLQIRKLIMWLFVLAGFGGFVYHLRFIKK